MFKDAANDLIKNEQLLKMLYDVVRAVDPQHKHIIDYNTTDLDRFESSCYDFWKAGKACENCVSIRAYMEDQAFVKIEYNGERVYMITAIPTTIQGKRVIVELLKDVTESGIIENINSKDSGTIRQEIDAMNQLVMTDALTQLYNRRYVDERLPYDILDCMLNDKAITVALVDLDGFKAVNDQYGHAAGDKALEVVSGIFKSCIRKNGDWVARYGGDEFLICLKDADHKQALHVVERMREQVEQAQIDIDGAIVRVTASFGVQTLYNQDMDVQRLKALIDEKLYEAKRQGKNKVL